LRRRPWRGSQRRLDAFQICLGKRGHASRQVGVPVCQGRHLRVSGLSANDLANGLYGQLHDHIVAGPRTRSLRSLPRDFKRQPKVVDRYAAVEHRRRERSCASAVAAPHSPGFLRASLSEASVPARPQRRNARHCFLLEHCDQQMKPLLAQLRVELILTPRRGESLLITVVVPVVLLVFFGAVAANPPDFLVPGLLALAVMSTSMVS